MEKYIPQETLVADITGEAITLGDAYKSGVDRFMQEAEPRGLSRILQAQLQLGEKEENQMETNLKKLRKVFGKGSIFGKPY